MRVAFLGSSTFGIPTLERLYRDHELLAVVTQPARPAGRGKSLTPTPVAAWAAEHAPGVPVFEPEDVNEPEAAGRLRGLGADAWVVIAYGQKLSEALLEGVFAINLHASLLPRWRGAAPIHAAILAGDEKTGNSVITIARRMDAGLVLGQRETPIGAAETTGDLHDRLAAEGPALIEDVLARHEAGTLEPAEQDEAQVTRARKLGPEDRWVDFSEPADACRRRINAMSPRPGIAVALRGEDLKLLRAQVAGEESARAAGAAPGEIVDPNRGLVHCGQGTILQLLEVQPAGRRAMGWGEFARGRDVQAGETLEGVRVQRRGLPAAGRDGQRTLWDLLARPKRPPGRPGGAGGAAKQPPKIERPPTAKGPERPGGAVARKAPTMAERYEAVTREMLATYGVRVRKWRSSMSGVAWQVTYTDGRTSRLIEAPRPRGPMSCAVFLHEIGHHAIGFGVYRPRCLEEYHAWRFAIEQMEARGLNVSEGVRRRMHESLRYAICKARRRGLKTLPAELVAFVEPYPVPSPRRAARPRVRVVRRAALGGKRRC